MRRGAEAGPIQGAIDAALVALNPLGRHQVSGLLLMNVWNCAIRRQQGKRKPKPSQAGALAQPPPSLGFLVPSLLTAPARRQPLQLLVLALPVSLPDSPFPLFPLG